VAILPPSAHCAHAPMVNRVGQYPRRGTHAKAIEGEQPSHSPFSLLFLIQCHPTPALIYTCVQFPFEFQPNTDFAGYVVGITCKRAVEDFPSPKPRHKPPRSIPCHKLSIQ
jgi:hypothetical protein